MTGAAISTVGGLHSPPNLLPDCILPLKSCRMAGYSLPGVSTAAQVCCPIGQARGRSTTHWPINGLALPPTRTSLIALPSITFLGTPRVEAPRLRGFIPTRAAFALAREFSALGFQTGQQS